jgi:hypothetical protein
MTSRHAVAGLLTGPQAASETCGRHFRRGRETHAEQGETHAEQESLHEP